MLYINFYQLAQLLRKFAAFTGFFYYSWHKLAMYMWIISFPNIFYTNSEAYSSTTLQ